ncbi:STAS domain-containing protein [Paracidovorax valerianellae]|uniref:STAS domain-containing protein n=1 Tax=Paracidovorax valerianellae TaxID=187868 RepID=A0A1G6Q6F4_9BURK|nr:STAS domain-containing protein [Paracidovorax valerianellae]MDA8444451.1 STAS domain-containing protein [Paracidovorax valerianellae]SDC88060.1 STAS domain-containing protein [Paracidovorax valerianellae]
MSKEETSPGLLSKMVRFVRNPTVNWTDLDSIDADRESQYSKQMLKEMIERKRRNDFVRRREFDQLRKLRKREALQGQRTEDPTARPSFFQSSMASPDDRAVTLKKIDEIEAQMSQQWWKSKNTAAPSELGDMGSPESKSAADARAFAPTAPASLTGALSAPTAVQPLFTGESLLPGASSEGGAIVPPAQQPVPSAHASALPAAPAVAPEPEEFVHEPDLEEAAIRFANGDHAGAESGLLEVLAQHEQDDPQQQLEIWMTLFDLYRAIGEHERFDALAIDYAARFSRSAPLWFSMPELLGLQVQAAPAATGLAQREFSWNAPAALAAQSVVALQASLARAAPPWTLTWSRLATIDEAAVPLLANLFTQWAEQEVQLSFFGVDALNAMLESRTQSGDSDTSPEWWRLRMAALRLMGRPDEFELVALDYCVTYEVSPPSWVSPRCSYSSDDGSAPAAEAASLADLHASGYGDPASMPAGLESGDLPASLSGHIEGDAAPLLEPFEERLKPGAPLIISCDRLIRVDFAAAGSVLNWAAEQQAQGHAVHFINLQRLVAVFFNVIGVNEHAWVVPRKN